MRPSITFNKLISAISAEKWAWETKCPDWMKQKTLLSPPPSILTVIIFHLQCRDIGLPGAIKGMFISDCWPLYLNNWNRKHSQTLWEKKLEKYLEVGGNRIETVSLWLKKDTLTVHCTKLETLRQMRLTMNRENAFHHPNSLTHKNIQMD